VELELPDYCAAMSDEIQALHVVNRLFPLILNGEKTSTIRWREKQVILGPCDISVMVTRPKPLSWM